MKERISNWVTTRLIANIHFLLLTILRNTIKSIFLKTTWWNIFLSALWICRMHFQFMTQTVFIPIFRPFSSLRSIMVGLMTGLEASIMMKTVNAVNVGFARRHRRCKCSKTSKLRKSIDSIWKWNYEYNYIPNRPTCCIKIAL